MLATPLPHLAAMIDVVMGLVMTLFVIATLLLMVVILIQEGKGGGVTSMFGGGFAETFGVKAGTVNRFTAYLAAAFLGLALLYAGFASKAAEPKLKDLPSAPAPEVPGTGPGAVEAPPVPPGEGAPPSPPGDAAPPSPPGDAAPPAPPGDAAPPPGPGSEKPADGSPPPAPGAGAGGTGEGPK